MSEENKGPINPLEIELEEAIQRTFEHDRELLHRKGLPLEGTLFRQWEIPGYGKPDLMAVSFELVRRRLRYYEYDENNRRDQRRVQIQIVELKRGPLVDADVQQICRYMRGAYNAAQRLGYGPRMTVDIHGYLVGKGIDRKAKIHFVADCIPDLSLLEWKLDMAEGIVFERLGDYYAEREDPDRLMHDAGPHLFEGYRTAYRRSMRELPLKLR